MQQGQQRCLGNNFGCACAVKMGARNAEDVHACRARHADPLTVNRMRGENGLEVRREAARNLNGSPASHRSGLPSAAANGRPGANWAEPGPADSETPMHAATRQNIGQPRSISPPLALRRAADLLGVFVFSVAFSLRPGSSRLVPRSCSINPWAGSTVHITEAGPQGATWGVWSTWGVLRNMGGPRKQHGAGGQAGVVVQADATDRAPIASPLDATDLLCGTIGPHCATAAAPAHGLTQPRRANATGCHPAQPERRCTRRVTSRCHWRSAFRRTATQYAAPPKRRANTRSGGFASLGAGRATPLLLHGVTLELTPPPQCVLLGGRSSQALRPFQHKPAPRGIRCPPPKREGNPTSDRHILCMAKG